MSKFGDVIKQARKPDDQISVKPEIKTTSKPEPDVEAQEEMVNLCVKVPKRLRSHWAAEAKRNDITMTDVMMEALKAKFGLPSDK
jgi:NRPS condensation-like uncharacterized protein